MTKKRLAAVLVTAAALLSALGVAIASTFESESPAPIVSFEHPWPVGAQVVGVMESSATYIATVRYVDPVRGFYIMDYNDNSFWQWSFADVDKNIQVDIANAKAGGSLVLLILRVGDASKVLWEATY